MNQPYLEHCQFIMYTSSPVFIGSGEQISSKEYIYDNNCVSFISMPRVYGYLMRHHLFEKYQKFNGTLYHFLSSNIKNKGICDAWKTYEIKVDRDVFKSKKSGPNLSAIQTFIKDPYGCPYIPGSSLKGMLRTILESAWYLKHSDAAADMAEQIDDRLYHGYKRKKDPLNDIDTAMSVETFHRKLFPDKDRQFSQKQITAMVNDSMRGLIVGDSAPLELSDLCICQKIDVDKNGRQTAVPLFRECLKPGIKVTFDVTIDTQLFPFTRHEIILAMKAFYQYYQQVFMQHFKKVSPPYGNSTTFFLGGGSGYVSKTAAYAVLQDDYAVETVSDILDRMTFHNHGNDDRAGVSPRFTKCTRYNGKLYQMGACYLASFK